MSILSRLIDLILPPRCAVCGKVMNEDKGICDECISQIDFINHDICYRCGNPHGNIVDKKGHKLCPGCAGKRRGLFRLSRSAYSYDDFSKKLVLDLKFNDKTDLAPLLAKMMYVAGQDIFAAGVDVIVPVPLHYTRFLKRKYNQSALLAKELSKLTKIPVSYNSLIKKRITKPQVECSGIERIKNLKNAFELTPSQKLSGKRVLLIDDVLTTGSTLAECGRTIKKSKPRSIDTLTIARAL